jgi:hypothetical protein
MTEGLTCDTPETRGSSTEELQRVQRNYLHHSYENNHQFSSRKYDCRNQARIDYSTLPFKSFILEIGEICPSQAKWYLQPLHVYVYRAIK